MWDQVGGSVVLDIAQGVLEDRLEAAA